MTTYKWMVYLDGKYSGRAYVLSNMRWHYRQGGLHMDFPRSMRMREVKEEIRKKFGKKTIEFKHPPVANGA